MNKEISIKKLLEGVEVEWKTLGEATFWDKKFQGVNKALQPKILSFKHVSSKKLKSLNIPNGNIKLLSTGKFNGYTIIKLADEYLNKGEVITIPTGGSANLKYYNGKFVDSGNLLACSRDISLFNLKYIYFFLLNINEKISGFFRGSGVKHPSMLNILKIEIPIPPLSIQN
jgi:type I restriction enzyme S subunit